VTLYSADISQNGFNTTASGRAAPLAALSGGRLAQKFQAWQGVSGQRYVCSVFAARDPAAMEAVTSYSDAVVLVVRRDHTGAHRLVAIGDSGALPELFWHGAAIAALRAKGVDEFHIHLMAETSALRQQLIEDILARVRH